MTQDGRARLEAVAGPVSRETWEAILGFMETFRRWSARINLAAPSTLSHLFERHVVDSAQLLALAPEATRWADLGSGGGFPGAIVAILLKDRANAHVDLIESNHKKAAFLTTALNAARAPARVHARRIEEATHVLPAPEIVTARALAGLDDLIGLAQPWLDAGATGLFHKGRDWRREVAESPRAAAFNLLPVASVVDADSVVLRVERRGSPAGGESRTETTPTRA